MPLAVILLIALGVAAILVGGYALVSMAQRRQVLARAGAIDDPAEAPAIALRPVKEQRQGRIREWLLESLPGSPTDDAAAQEKMVQAGYDSPTAPATDPVQPRADMSVLRSLPRACRCADYRGCSARA